MQNIGVNNNFKVQPRKLNLKSISPELSKKLKEFDGKGHYFLQDLDRWTNWCNTYSLAEGRTIRRPEEDIMQVNLCTLRQALHIIYEEKNQYKPDSIIHLKPYFDFLDTLETGDK